MYYKVYILLVIDTNTVSKQSLIQINHSFLILFWDSGAGWVVCFFSAAAFMLFASLARLLWLTFVNNLPERTCGDPPLSLKESSPVFKRLWWRFCEVSFLILRSNNWFTLKDSDSKNWLKSVLTRYLVEKIRQDLKFSNTASKNSSFIMLFSWVIFTGLLTVSLCSNKSSLLDPKGIIEKGNKGVLVTAFSALFLLDDVFDHLGESLWLVFSFGVWSSKYLSIFNVRKMKHEWRRKSFFKKKNS